jgi:hypothetical protein
MVRKIYMQQVHGNNVVVVDSKNIGQVVPECDGLITNDPNVILVVKTADCLPISIADTKQKVIALVHAGWRGLQKEIIKNSVNILTGEFKCNSKDLKIKIGPHICQIHYEVGKEVWQLFENIRGAVVHRDKTHLCLYRVAKRQLIDLGVKKENIKVDLRCTFEDLSLPSYRRGDRNKRIETKLHLSGVMI